MKNTSNSNNNTSNTFQNYDDTSTNLTTTPSRFSLTDIKISQQNLEDGQQLNPKVQRQLTKNICLESENKMLLVGIVVNGVVAPGVNHLIKYLVNHLAIANVKKIIGIKFGYSGLIKEEFEILDTNVVEGIDNLPGIYLGTCSDNDSKNMKPQTLAKRMSRFNIIYVLGGLSTFQYLGDVRSHITSKTKVIGIPYGYMGDFPYIDYELGFNTSLNIGMDILEAAQCECMSHRYSISMVSLPLYKTGRYAMTVGVDIADIILTPEFDIYLKGAKSFVSHVVKALSQQMHLIVLVCEGAKKKVQDDDGVKNSARNMCDILMDRIKEEVKGCDLPDLIDNLNFKKFNMDYIICTETRVSNSDVRLAEQLSRYALNEIFLNDNYTVITHKEGKMSSLSLDQLLTAKNQALSSTDPLCLSHKYNKKWHYSTD